MTKLLLLDSLLQEVTAGAMQCILCKYVIVQNYGCQKHLSGDSQMVDIICDKGILPWMRSQDAATTMISEFSEFCITVKSIKTYERSIIFLFFFRYSNCTDNIRFKLIELVSEIPWRSSAWNGMNIRSVLQILSKSFMMTHIFLMLLLSLMTKKKSKLTRIFYVL